jgi:hypothetical protein
MRNFRYNIASLVGVIVFFGVSFAALRESNDLWESGIFTLTLGVLFVSILLAVHRNEANRAFWVGFALFGWGYLALAQVPSIESRLLTTKGLAYLDSKVPGRPSAVATILLSAINSANSGNQVQNVAFSLDGLKVGTSSRGVVRVWDAATGKLLSGWGGTTEHFVRIGHSLIALIAAWIGGLLSRRLSRGSRLQPVSMASATEG